MPGKIYRDVNKIFSKMEVVDEIMKAGREISAQLKDPLDARDLLLGFASAAGHFNEFPHNSGFVPLPDGRKYDFLRLQNDDQVFDSEGNRLWPTHAMPQTKPN